MPRDFCVDPIRPGTGRSASHATASPSLRQTYRLTVVCHASDRPEIEATLERVFREQGLRISSLRRDQTSFMFVRITALVDSSISERAGIVWIVNKLAGRPSIRRLQWETVPVADPATGKTTG